MLFIDLFDTSILGCFIILLYFIGQFTDHYDSAWPNTDWSLISRCDGTKEYRPRGISDFKCLHLSTFSRTARALKIE